MSDYSCIVLAAGDRQHPEDPGDGKLAKNLALINGKPVIRHVVDNAIAAGVPAHKVTVVVKQKLEDNFRQVFADTDVRLAFQDVARGSADAVRLVIEQDRLAMCRHVLMLMGDQANFLPSTLTSLMARHKNIGKLVTVTTFLANRSHPAFQKCGVVITDVLGHFSITRPDIWGPEMPLHAGPYVFRRSWLHECITHINWNLPGEIHVYLAVAAAAALGNGILTYDIPDPWEALGIDTYEALQAIRRGDRSYLNLPQKNSAESL